MEKIKKLFASTVSKNGSYSVGLIAVAICIVIVVNMIVGQLPENVRSIDISDNRIYEISDVSREILDELDQEITFTVYADKSTADDMIKTFVEKYTDLSKKIAVEWVDPVLHPGELEEKGVSEETILIECAETGKSTTVSFSDILVVDEYSYYMTGDSSATQFDGEGQFTAAVNYVTSDAAKKIYYTSGHGENTFSTSVYDLLDKNNYEEEELNLLMATEIPSDCDLLFMYAPAKDLTEDELKMVQDYMAAGGDVMILLGAMDTEAPNLDAFLSEYGMVREDGYIADMQRCYQGNYYYIFPELYSTEGITDGLSSDMVLLIDAHGMTLTDPARDTITVDGFMTTSSDAYAVTEETQEQGTFTIGALAVEEITAEADTSAEATSTEATSTEAVSDTDVSDDESSDTDDSAKTVESRLTVITAETLIDSGVTDSFTSLENLDLFMNSVSANFDGVENVAIEAKSLEVTYNTMQHAGLISLLVIFGIPAVILIYGFLTWWKRRKA